MKKLLPFLLFLSPTAFSQIDLSTVKPELPAEVWQTKQYKRVKDYTSKRSHKGITNPDWARWKEWEKLQRSGQARTSQAASVWTNYGPDEVSGRLISVAFHPTDTNTMYVGSAGGGLWKTTDYGKNWTPLTDKLPSLAIGAVAINPRNPNTILIATGEGYNLGGEFTTGVGVLISYDGGNSFQNTSLTAALSQNFSGMDIIWSRKDTSKVCIASSFGVYFSNDGGKTYSPVLSRLPARMVADPKRPDTLYLSAKYYTSTYPGGIFRSFNAGQTWTQVSSGLPAPTAIGYTSLAVHPVYNNIVYASISKSSANGLGPLEGLYRSRNYGVSWTKINTNIDIHCYHPPYQNVCQGWYANTICLAPSDTNLIFAGGTRMWKSTNGGATWLNCDTTTQGGYAVHPDYHQMLYHPLTGHLVTLNDGGIDYTNNNGQNWTRISKGLITHQFYKVAFAQNDPDVVIGGAQDIGFFSNTQAHGSNPWTNNISGDGFGVAIDHSDKDTWYASMYFSYQRVKTSNAGFNWTQINSGATGDQWRMQIEQHPVNSLTLLSSSGNNIYRSLNGGASWNNVYNTGSISAFAFDRQNPNLVYAGELYGSNIYRSSSGGATWTQPGAGTPAGPITDLAVDPSVKGRVYASIGSFGTFEQVYRSNDSGLTWVNISANLPSVPANCIVVDPFDNQNIYVGTDLGVWVTEDGGVSWKDFNNNLPFVVVDDIHFHKMDSTIRVGTYGRGYWRTKALPPTLSSVELAQAYLLKASVFPNPSGGSHALTLRLANAKAGQAVIRISNLLSETVSTSNAAITTGANDVPLTAPQAAGIYIVSVITGGQEVNLRLVITGK